VSTLERDPLCGDISSKQSVNALFDAGKFGNKLRSWGTYAELQADAYAGPVMIRYRKPGSPFCVSQVPKGEVAEWVDNFVRYDGAERGLFSFIECGPDSGNYVVGVRTFQGEVRRSECYYDLTYSTVAAPMRDAMKQEQKYAQGLAAVQLLKAHLSASDWDWLQELFDHYPDGIIEFSVWNRGVGDCGRNMVVWEVRTY
jgi:hypothetical protein